MNNLVERLDGLACFSYYMAPDDGKVKPVKVSENLKRIPSFNTLSTQI